MSLANISSSLKRPANEVLDERPSKKVDDGEEDLKAIFDNFLAAVNYGEMTDEGCAHVFSSNPELMYSLNRCHFSKVEKYFREAMASHNLESTSRTKMMSILSKLYPVSLLNSSTCLNTQLANEKIPVLKETLSKTTSKKLHDLVRNARALLRTEDLKRPEEVDLKLTKIEETISQLEPYKQLNEYQDDIENQRIIDLATHCKRINAETKYPSVYTGFKAFLGNLKPFTSDLKLVSEAISNLGMLKITFIKLRSVLKPEEVKEVSLATRFIKAFGITFYQAFKLHFWNLILNSRNDPKFGEILRDVKSDVKDIDEQVVRVWERCFPDIDFEDWMLYALEGIGEDRLNQLEKELQESEKEFNETHECQMDSTLKRLFESQSREKMKLKCLEATKSAFLTLGELSSFLMKQTEK